MGSRQAAHPRLSLARRVVLRSSRHGHVVWRTPFDGHGLRPRLVERRPLPRCRLAARGWSCSTRRARPPHGLDARAPSSCSARSRPARTALRVSIRLPARSEVRVVDVDRPGHAQAPLRRAGRLRRPRLVARRQWLLVAGRRPTSGSSLHGVRVHAVANIEAAVSARRPAGAELQTRRPLVLRLESAGCSRRRPRPRRDGLPRPERADDDARAGRGRAEAALLLPVRLVVDLNERDGAPA